MALKTWLINKIEKQEQGLKFLKALLIMLIHVENADYDSDSDNSLNIDDIELADDDEDDDDVWVQRNLRN